MQKILRRLAAGLVVLAAVAVAGAWLLLRASLPVLDGRIHAHGIDALVSIERDALGVVTVTGGQRADVAFGLGYAHGQDRFFQMDLMRRAAAGELSQLLGAATLDTDRELRVHRFRAVARAIVARASAEERTLLDAYTAGVNAGVGSLRARPFEYLLLSSAPEPWRAEDSVLTVLAMFLQLQEPDGHGKRERGLLHDALPESVTRFVYAEAGDWSTTLDGSGSVPPSIPAAADYDLGRLGALDFAPPARHAHAPAATTGSNNWAIAGRRTASGAALVANDMHLGIRVPNTWYRARLHWRDASGAEADVTGVTLPGAPAVVTGSNGHIAWGFTNSYGDFQDIVVIVADPQAADHYLAPDGSKAFTHARERILVKDAEPVDLDVVATDWGPVIGHDAKGRALALAWTAHDPVAVNFALNGLDRAQSVDAALALAARAGIPAQNFVVGDRDGHIGWTIAGQVPTRRGEATLPHLSTDPAAGFSGWLADADRPRVVDPATGQLQTANARVVGGRALAAIGDGGYDRGARVQQIALDLAARGDGLQPADMLGVQLDDRARFLARWQVLLSALLDADACAAQPRRAELAAVLARWSGHAAVDDAAYRLVRAFRMQVERRVYFALIAPARAANPDFRFRVPASFEGPLWALVSARPAHLLPPGQADWRAFLLAAADATLAELTTDCPVLADCSWGRANVVRIRHPLSAAVPGLARLVDIPAESLPGDEDMPRVQGTDFGASERFAVSPGHESEALFAMPGGQSGHPLSAYFRAGHEHWAHGTPAPFLPGAAEHHLTLTP